VFLDTAVLVYAIGGEHPLRDPCRSLLRAVGAGEVDAVTSALAVQELLHQRARRLGDRGVAVDQVRPLLDALTIVPIDPAAARLALDLYAGSDLLDAADALHAATALTHGVTQLVSPDAAFDGVEGLSRLTPEQAVSALG
jgi:predicted nucleic acid-binding protein